MQYELHQLVPDGGSERHHGCGGDAMVDLRPIVDALQCKLGTGTGTNPPAAGVVGILVGRGSRPVYGVHRRGSFSQLSTTRCVPSSRHPA